MGPAQQEAAIPGTQGASGLIRVQKPRLLFPGAGTTETGNVRGSWNHRGGRAVAGHAIHIQRDEERCPHWLSVLEGKGTCKMSLL